jgi:serine/threonine protein kinase
MTMKAVGRYEIAGRLGRGGMSTVYKAKAPVTGRIVALKVLDPRDDIFVHMAGEERLRQVFVEEARVMGEISHPHIAKILDCDDDHGLPFIVLEYFAHSLGNFIGESYRVEQPSRTISVAKASSYLIQALKGLERLHFSGIIHRDIKPFNLMITNDDRIKIIDFGLSRIRGEEKMKIPGLQVGSPYYAAPEQAFHPEKADERADLYSLGVLAYRMLTGRLPVEESGCLALPSSYRPDLDSSWDDLIMRSIAGKPADRFATAEQMRRELEGVYAQWAKASKVGCRFEEDECDSDGSRSVRAEPRRILYKDARDFLWLDGLMRPVHYHRQNFELIDPLVVRDPDTGLLWQTKGPEYTLDWQQAEAYVDHLNKRKWHDRADWRLPTAEELMTILRPPTVDRDFCLHSAFSRDIHWLWSSDWCTNRQAWMVDIIECFAERLDKDGAASVCAVSSSVGGTS